MKRYWTSLLPVFLLALGLFLVVSGCAGTPTPTLQPEVKPTPTLEAMPAPTLTPSSAPSGPVKMVL